jgi:hypothetical protein
VFKNVTAVLKFVLLPGPAPSTLSLSPSPRGACAASSKQQAVSSKQQPASSNQQPASSNHQAATSKQQAASSKQRQIITTNGKHWRLTSNTQQAAGNINRT